MKRTQTATLPAILLIPALTFGGWGQTPPQKRTQPPGRQKIVSPVRGGKTESLNASAHPPAAEATPEQQRRRTLGNPILYHGGPLMTGTVNLYYIWYGNWSGNSATTILIDFASYIGGSPYSQIYSDYSTGGKVISGHITYARSMNDNYSKGKSLTDSAIETIVTSAITSGQLPNDSNGIYFVLTSSDVTASSGFCRQYCTWHTHANIQGTSIKYAFVGNPDQCPLGCEYQTVGPNGNAAADAMAMHIAHTLSNTITDPELNAWYDRHGEESAMKCVWNFGATSRASNGAEYNVRFGMREYLVMQNWRMIGGCALY